MHHWSMTETRAWTCWILNRVVNLFRRNHHRIAGVFGLVWRSTVIHVWGVFINFCIDLMTGRRLHVRGDEEIVGLFHHICIVLQIVTVYVLAGTTLILAAFDNSGNDDNKDDDNDAAADTGNDDPPLPVITGKTVHINLLKSRIITSSSINNIPSLGQLPKPQQSAITLQRNT